MNVELHTSTPPPLRVSPPRPPLHQSVHAPEETGPLSNSHLDQITLARQRARKVRKACTVAMVNACILIAFSGLTLLMSMLAMMFGQFDLLGLIMGSALAALAWNELRGRGLLARIQLRGCGVLGWNQLGLMAIVLAYSIWMIGHAIWGPSPYDEAIAKEAMLAGPLGSINALHKIISIAIYGGLIVGTLIFQGLNSLYYFTRRKHVEAYISQTPDWVLDLQRRGAA